MPYWKALVWFLTITSVFMSASYTMLVPFLPMYLIDELGVAQSDVNIWSGLIFSISFLISAIMAPIWGAVLCKPRGSFLPCEASRAFLRDCGQLA